MSPVFVPQFNQPVMTPHGPGRYQRRVDVLRRGSDTEIADTVFLVLPDNPTAIEPGVLRGGVLPLPPHDVWAVL